MIVKSSMVIFILSYALISDVTGASYSSVYVGSDVIPVEYAQYGAPYTSIVNPRLSRINALPPISGYVPCESPCIYPTKPITTVTPVVNPNANILTYKTAVPSVPIVVTPTKEEATGYEYSYVVYDENTGDHKAQRELSDGAVVRGEYSFLQPDGYVREVKYVADDVSGFNAVVKNFLPVAVEGKRKVEVNSKKESSPPCHEVKNESLKEESAEEVNKSSEKEGSKQKNKEESVSVESKDSGEQSKEKLKVEPEIQSQEVKKEEKSPGKPDDKAKLLQEESGEKSKEDQEKSENSKEESGEKASEEPKEKLNSKEESSEESKENKSKEESGEKSNVEANKENQKESGEDSVSGEEVKEELKESKENHKKKSKKGPIESSESEESYERLTQSKNKEVHELLLLQPEREVQVPYKDILRCIQAAIKRANGVPSDIREEASPLTYIILNKPC